MTDPIYKTDALIAEAAAELSGCGVPEDVVVGMVGRHGWVLCRSMLPLPSTVASFAIPRAMAGFGTACGT